MARSFDGSTQYGSAANSTTLGLTDSWAVSCWFNVATFHVSGYDSIFGGTVVQILINDASREMAVYIGAFSVIDPAGPTILANTWYNVILTGVPSGAGTYTVYVNGSNIGNRAGSGAQNATTTFNVANDVNGDHLLNGSIADAAVWNMGAGATLTQNQINAIVSGVRPPNVDSANLKLWWPLDGFASPEPDLSGQSNNCTLTASPPSALGPPALWRISGSLPGVALPAAGLNWMINRRDKLGWMPRRKK